MYVDQTMITGHLDHARFSGERFGRILNLLIRFAQRISHGRSTRSLEEDVAGRVAKRHFARACGLWSPKRLSRKPQGECKKSENRLYMFPGWGELQPK